MNTLTIEVCWKAAYAQFTNEMGWTRAAIAGSIETYSSYRFTGWGVCDNTEKARIEITVEDSMQTARDGTRTPPTPTLFPGRNAIHRGVHNENRASHPDVAQFHL